MDVASQTDPFPPCEAFLQASSSIIHHLVPLFCLTTTQADLIDPYSGLLDIMQQTQLPVPLVGWILYVLKQLRGRQMYLPKLFTSKFKPANRNNRSPGIPYKNIRLFTSFKAGSRMANTAAKVLSTGPLVCISQSMTRAYIVTNSKRTVR